MSISWYRYFAKFFDIDGGFFKFLDEALSGSQDANILTIFSQSSLIFCLAFTAFSRGVSETFVDFLAIGKNKEALHWQNQLFKNFRQGEKVNLRQGEELDPASAKSVVLADAYDLNARIEAAMGQLGSALRDLDSAVDALPKNSKAAPREAAYYYHRALIFAVNLKFNEAAKACRKSFRVWTRCGLQS